MSWRKLFPLIFLFSCVDGFIANLLYPAKLPFLYRDMLILFVYFLFITQESQRGWVGKFKRTIGSGVWYTAMLFILVGVFQIFNPELPNAIVGLLGFKVMFFYWPLAILAYAYVDNLKRMQDLLRKIIYFSIPICVFGLYQFWADPYFMVEKFGPGFEGTLVMAFLGESRESSFLRIIGTFASTGQFSMFLVVNNMFIFGLLFMAKTKFERRLMAGCALLNFITMLATGSRFGIALIFITSFMFVLLCRRLWRRLVLTFLLGISLYLGFNYLGRGVVARMETLRDTTMIKERTIEATSGVFMDYLQRYPLGQGIGSGSSAIRHLGGEEGMEWELVENYPSKLQYEMGILGVILFYLFLIRLSIRWMKYWLKFTAPQNYVLVAALSSLCFIAFAFSLFGIIDSPPFAIFLWFAVGMSAKVSAIQSYDKRPIST